MSNAIELLRQGKTKDIWQKYCGFIDLDIEEFMSTQQRLLMEQLRLIEHCELGRKMLWGMKPSSITEFRQMVPLTSYKDYASYLLKKRDDVLPEKALFWQRTAGGLGPHRFKWVPITERHYREIGVYLMAWAIFSSCKERGDVALREGDKVFYGMAPPPYPTGSLARVLDEEFAFDIVPPRDKAEKMSYQNRMEQAVSMAVPHGLDFTFALSSVLTSLGDQISRGAAEFSLRSALLRPKMLGRLARGRLRSRLEKRAMLPKDLWRLKGLASTGTDSAVFREQIAHYWGRYPLEAYGCAELGVVALQTWDYKDMTFTPTIAFFEFLSEEEQRKAQDNPAYRPKTVLLSEVAAGKKYEIVFTSLQGGPFVRYRIGDMIKVTARRNQTLGIDLPQIRVDSRADAIIDIGGFARLTEKVIGEAIRNSRLTCEVWTARKEIVEGQPLLHIYLKKLDHDYLALEDMLGLQPLAVTLLPRGTFFQYLRNEQTKSGDASEPVIPHLNAPEELLRKLLATKLDSRFRGYLR